MSTYSQPPSPIPEQVDDYIGATELTKITPLQHQELEEPLGINEIYLALHQMARNKVPGTDGLPVEFYNAYKTILTPRLLDIYLGFYDMA